MDKKNTVLLTVIAIATLLVAVVGATFAYFTAAGGTGTTANVTVTTGTAASVEFGALTNINIYADATTFSDTGEHAGTEDGERSHSGTATGNIKWTAPGASSGSTPSASERTMCYTAKLNVTGNTFVKSAANTSDKAELEFTAKKGSTVLINQMDITTTSTDVNIPTQADGSNYKHTLVAEAGQEVSDSWDLTVTLVNYNFNQNDNAGKQFTAILKFEKVDCD